MPPACEIWAGEQTCQAKKRVPGACLTNSMSQPAAAENMLGAVSHSRLYSAAKQKN